jgi:hypothetical protein
LIEVFHNRRKNTVNAVNSVLTASKKPTAIFLRCNNLPKRLLNLY